MKVDENLRALMNDIDTWIDYPDKVALCQWLFDQLDKADRYKVCHTLAK
jgi:hypothetical protein